MLREGRQIASEPEERRGGQSVVKEPLETRGREELQEKRGGRTMQVGNPLENAIFERSTANVWFIYLNTFMTKNVRKCFPWQTTFPNVALFGTAVTKTTK